MGLSYGRRFDPKKFKEGLIEPKNINDMESDHKQMVLETLVLLLERSYSYYLEYKSNTS